MRIKTRGLKDSDHDIELGRLNLIEGPNGAGKSAIADAIRFLALGHVPQLGKRHQDAAALMAGDTMEVELTLDDGRVAVRRLVREGKGLSMEAECSWLKNAKPAEHHKAIVSLFGKEEADAAETLDVRTLLDATPAQRARRIEELMSATASDPARLAERAAALTAARLTGRNLDDVDDWKDLLPTLKSAHRRILKADVSGPLQARIGEDGMASACKWANDRKRDADNGLRAKRSAAAEIEKRVEGMPDAGDQVERLKKDRDRLQREMGAARERVGAEEKEKGRRGELDARADELRRDVEGYQARICEVSGDNPAEGLDDDEIESVRLLIADVRGKGDDHVKKANQLRTQALDIESALEIVPSLDGQEQILRKAEQDLRLAESGGWAEVRELAAPLVGHKTKKIDAIGRQLSELAQEKGAIESLSSYRDALDLARKILADARKVTTGIEKANAKQDERVTKLRSRADAQEEKAVAQRKNADDRTAHLNEFLERFANLRRLEDLSEAKREELARIEKDLGKPATVLLDPMERVKIQERLDEVDGRLDDLEKNAVAREELGRIKAEIEDEAALSEVMHAVEWACLRVREEEVTAAGGPLVSGIRGFLDAAGVKAEPYFRASRGVCSIGWIRDGKEVDVKVLSGGEWALYSAALVTTILHIRAPELPVLLVEAGETDGPRLDGLVAGLTEFRDDLGLALVLTPRKLIDLPGQGWARILLAEEEESVEK